MELFRNTEIDFLRWKWVAIGTSWALILIGIISIIAHHGLRFGIDFSGGSQIVLRFRSQPHVDELRKTLDRLSLGVTGIQRIGDPALNEVLIRVQQQKKEGRDVAQEVLSALSRELSVPAPDKIDINVKGRDTLATALTAADPDHFAATGTQTAAQYYEGVSERVFAYRSQAGIFSSVDEVDRVPEVSAAVKSWIKQNCVTGPFTLLSADNVGPQVGHDLQRKALLAVIWSIIGMLVYIAVRFDLKFGVGAIVALVHDTLITVGLLSLFDREITLVVVAALLTLVGYSVNDTVVVYDRIRENLKAHRREALPVVINKSINQTLSRTVLTSGLTMLVVIALFFFGGEVLNTFALTLWIGIIVGTYSSIYVASPIVVIWSDFLERRKAAARAASGSPVSSRRSAKR
jgi:preprotein translocase subunit SecF